MATITLGNYLHTVNGSLALFAPGRRIVDRAELNEAREGFSCVVSGQDVGSCEKVV